MKFGKTLKRCLVKCMYDEDMAYHKTHGEGADGQPTTLEHVETLFNTCSAKCEVKRVRKPKKVVSGPGEAPVEGSGVSDETEGSAE